MRGYEPTPNAACALLKLSDYTPDEFAIAQDVVAEVVAGLNARYRVIFFERLMCRKSTLQVLGDRFGVSRERIRQIERRITYKMRKAFHERAGRFPS